MTAVFIRIEGVNPQPWTPGEVGRRGKFSTLVKDQQLVVYQAAIQELLGAHVERKNRVTTITKIPGGFADWFEPLDMPLRVEFRLWRRIEQWETPAGRKQSSRIADATNMQKALEDALQGIVFKNDKKNTHITTDVREQAKGIEPAIEIEVRERMDGFCVPFHHFFPAVKLNADNVGITWSVVKS